MQDNHLPVWHCHSHTACLVQSALKSTRASHVQEQGQEFVHRAPQSLKVPEFAKYFLHGILDAYQTHL
jgi:hypothetical protein